LAALDAELKATRDAIKNPRNNDPDLKQRCDLLGTIPGVSDATIAHLLVVLNEHHGFSKAKPVVAFAGLAPALRESGQGRAWRYAPC
jgi:hypothetical protein